MICEYCGCKFLEDSLGDCRRCSAPPPAGFLMRYSSGVSSTYEFITQMPDEALRSCVPEPILTAAERKLASIVA